MIALVAENLGADHVRGAFVVTLLLGYPVAFFLGAVGLIFFVVGVELAPYSSGVVTLSWKLLQSMPGRIFDVMRNDHAIGNPILHLHGPLFLERVRPRDLLSETVGQLFGTLARRPRLCRDFRGRAVGGERRASWRPASSPWASSRCPSCCAMAMTARLPPA